MESYNPQKFARRVLSSTRISEDNDNEHSRKFDRLRAETHSTSRRRLRILDDDDDDEKSDSENVDPSLFSDPLLPSSIPFPPATDDFDASDGSGGQDDYSEPESYRSEYSDNSASPGSPTARMLNQPRMEEHQSRMGGSDHLSPPAVGENIGRNDDVDEDVLTRLRKATKGAAKRTVKNPRPKLDSQRLLSDKGLPALLNDFKKVHFRGKGFEFQDLDRLLFVYAAWANRLVPKSTFPEVIERLEKAGTSREIRVALHRLRSGIWPPYASAEHVPGDDDDESDTQPQQDNAEDEELAWERALRDVPQPNVSAYEPMKTSSSLTEGANDPVLDSLTSVPGPSTADFESAESRAERNRQLALQRLEARRKSATLTQGLTASPQPNLLKSAFVASVSSDTNTSAAP